MTHKFDLDTALERKDTSTFLGSAHPDWWVERGPNGGYLSALLLRALKATVDDPSRAIRSLTVHFVAPPADGALEITTAIERVGKSRVSASARLTQDGATMAVALAAFSASWASVEWAESSPPTVAPPDELDRVQRIEGLTPPFFSLFDARAALGDLPFSGSDRALTGGWIRFVEPRPIDDLAIASLADVWMPSAFTRMKQPAPVPTIDLTVHFRARLPRSGTEPEDFHLVRFRSEVAAEGFFVEDGEIWGSDGSLVAQARQLAVLMG